VDQVVINGGITIAGDVVPAAAVPATGHTHTATARTVDVLWTGRSELQSQLDGAVEDLRLKLNAVQEVERNAVRAAMLEERARYCLFIGAIKPLIVCIG